MATTFGSARFATREELQIEGMLGDTPPGQIPDGLMTGWWWQNKHDFEPLHYGGDLHQLIVGGTGSGKFTTALTPMLLGSGLDDQTVVAVDPKGQLAQLAGTFFQRPFAARDVFLLDPWDMCGTGQSLALNIIDTLRPDTNPAYIDDAQALADALISPSGGENMHWDETARGFLVALMLYLAVGPEEAGQRDLVRLRELVTLPWAEPKKYTGPKKQTIMGLLNAYRESRVAGGAIAEGFQGLLNRGEKEQSGILSILEKETRWIRSDAVRGSLRGKGIDLERASLEGGKYFIVIPPRYFHSHRAWVRLMVTAFRSAFMRWAPPRPDLPEHKRWRHIIIDEFANLGAIPTIISDAAVARDYRIKFTFVTQDFPLLKKAYGDAWESLVNNCFVRAFGVGDYFTAEYISKLVGSATVQNRSYGTSRSHSRGTSSGTSHGFGDSFSYSGAPTQPGSHGRSSNFSVTSGSNESTGFSASENVSDVQRSLMTPDEVRRLGEHEQLLIFRGMHAARVWRPPYWEMFLSLPDFSLKEVLDTVGREPLDAAERQHFLDWRDKPFLRAPEPIPPPAIAELPPPEAASLPPPGRTPWKLKTALIGGAALLFLYWVWPQKKPEPVVWVSPPPAPVEAVPSPPPPAAEPPRALPPPPPVVPVRAPVPGPNAVRDARGSAEVRDALLQMARDQINLCAPGHNGEERKLIGFLVDSARAKRGVLQGGMDADQRIARGQRMVQFLDDYLSRSPWSRAEREEVFELVLRFVHENYGSATVTAKSAQALDRLYAGNGCPLGEVPEADYLPPNYRDAFVIAASNQSR